MDKRDKRSLPHRDPAAPRQPITDPPANGDNRNMEIDVDDAMIEPPRDYVFEQAPDEDKRSAKAGKPAGKKRQR